MNRLKDHLDRMLGRMTMYRLVTVCLGVLAAVSILYGAAGVLDPGIFGVGPMLGTLTVLTVASLVSSVVLGRLWRRRPHLESAVITALLLWFLYWPATETQTYIWLAVAALLANLSKYALAWRGRHLFNPAAAGVVLVMLIGVITGAPVPRTTWWAASEALLPWVVVAALLVLYRTRRFAMAGVFVVVAAPLTVWGMLSFGSETATAVEYTAYSTPIVFFVSLMLSEPLTLAPRRLQQFGLAALAGVLFTWPLWTAAAFGSSVSLGPFEGTYELALLVVNAVAFGLGQRGGVRLRMLGRRELAPGIWEWSFRPTRPLRFSPGQYLELDLSGGRTDGRGARRAFSITSAPGAEVVTIAVRVPERPSAFKQRLLALEPGAVVHATALGGDFTWTPAPMQPRLLVAGGIGVTPFVSQLRHHGGDDAVLVYAVAHPRELAYIEELAQTAARVVVVAPEPPAALPAGWEHVAAPLLTREVLAHSVPDAATRQAFVSGPPAMVNAVRRLLPRARTDYFSGY
jgi:ferredoxin-NADP reductase